MQSVWWECRMYSFDSTVQLYLLGRLGADGHTGRRIMNWAFFKMYVSDFYRYSILILKNVASLTITTNKIKHFIKHIKRHNMMLCLSAISLMSCKIRREYFDIWLWNVRKTLSIWSRYFQMQYRIFQWLWPLASL